MTDQTTERQPWTFADEGPDREGSRLRALEFIAMYLDRIESHLSRIADAAEGRPTNDPEWERQKAIRGALRK